MYYNGSIDSKLIKEIFICNIFFFLNFLYFDRLNFSGYDWNTLMAAFARGDVQNFVGFGGPGGPGGPGPQNMYPSALLSYIHDEKYRDANPN
ncbi:MAG: hypothetical protein EOP34_01925 [Rickettsiales bacterium]|nr:MAG: hypothetical protein EOP34_01925 [Rickettsiales bacterium]